MQDKMTDTVLGPYRALDLTDEKGSFCTKLMGILGAEVIKIEKPGGSEERQIGPFYQGTPDPEKSLHWFLYNLNKKSITLDIASPDGKETFKKLVASADFVIESFAPGYLESIGLGYKELARIKPRLIVTSVTPFGQAGPYRDFKTSTLILHALGGLTWTVGEEGGRPVDTNSQLANIITGTQAALATMAAHYYREETGEGQYVDVSMQEGMINLALPVDLRWKSHHIMPYRAPAGPLFAGDLFGGGAMLGKAKDGYLVCMPTYWPGRDKVREWLASEGLAGDLFNPEWETIFKQGIAVPEDKRAYVFQLTQQLCARYTKKELVMEAQKKGIQFLPVSTIKELAEDVHLADRGYFRKVKHPELGTDITYHGFPFGLGEGLRKDWVRAPLIGEHNNELNDMLKPKKRQPAKRATAIDPADPRGALSGVRVADFSHVAVGPVTTHLLADFGAEVIKIESTARLEILRRQGPYKNNVPDLNGNILFNNYNQNKMSALLNLKHPKGVELAKKLVSISDVVSDSFTVGTMESLGLGYEDLKKVKPDIIVISMSVCGQTGPYRDFRGHGMVLQAMVGLDELTGWPDRGPVAPGTALTDHYLPPVWATAIIAALAYRRRTGKGQFIDASDFEAGVDTVDTALIDYFTNGNIRTRRGNRNGNAAPHGVYRCLGNDRWCAITIFTDDEWQHFCEMIGNPEWCHDRKFATAKGRVENTAQLDALVEEWTVKHTAEEVMWRLQQAGVPAGLAANPKDLYEDPQLRFRNHFWDPGLPELEAYTYESSAGRHSKTPTRFYCAAPLMGQHNEYVFTQLLGLSDEEFATLVGEGVIV